MTALTRLVYSAHCIDPAHPKCAWEAWGPDAGLEARRHVGELTGGPRPPHAVSVQGIPERDEK